ncbi:MAG: ATP synthase F1 subunit delta [Muribaculaceae bacterium]|nr:ATP synthase F1 subunit delta [Muribaculaceae bacterium]
MNEGLIPRRYAKALYKVAVEKSTSADMYNNMSTLVTSFAGNSELEPTIANPFIKDEQKIKLLNIAAGDDGKTTGYLFDDFLKLLVKNKRIDLIRAIALAYLDIYRKANNIFIVDVTSACQLNAEELERINKAVATQLPAGADIRLNTKIDPELIGGFVINLDNKQLDASVKNELKQLRLKLFTN